MPNHSLSAEPISLSYSQQSSGLPSLYADRIAISFEMPAAVIGRDMTVDIGSLELKLPRLPRIAIVDAKGVPTLKFTVWWQEVVKSIEGAYDRLVDAVEAIQAAYDAAAQASAAATEANNAAMAATTAVIEATADLETIKAGEFNFPKLTIGGTEFINDGAGGLQTQ